MGFLSSILPAVGTVAGTMFGGPIGGAVGGAIGSALGGGQSGSATSGPTQGNTAATAADPFASQRQQYQPQLQSLMAAGPGDTGLSSAAAMTQPGYNMSVQDPSYQFQMQQGTAAVNMGAAASGLLNSGNRLAALEQYGQGLASTTYNQQLQNNLAVGGAQENSYQNQYARLAQLAGANTGQPGQAGSLIQGQNAATSAGYQQLGSALAGSSLGQSAQSWASGLFGGSSIPGVAGNSGVADVTQGALSTDTGANSMSALAGLFS